MSHVTTARDARWRREPAAVAAVSGGLFTHKVLTLVFWVITDPNVHRRAAAAKVSDVPPASLPNQRSSENYGKNGLTIIDF